MARVDEKIGIKRAMSLHLWAAKVWWKVEPRLFLSSGFSAFAETLLPYLTIWFSARIIDELAGERNPERLGQLVLTTVLVTAGLSVICACLKRWKNAMHEMDMPLEERLMNGKLLNMEYAAVEATSTRDVLNEIRFHCMGNVFGFNKVHHWYIIHLINAVAAVVGAFALMRSFFGTKVPDTAEGLQWLDAPLTSIAFLLLLLGGILLSQMLQAKANDYHNKEIYPLANMSNRCMNAFGMMGFRGPRHLDIRMYEQQQVIWEMRSKYDSTDKKVDRRHQEVLAAIFASAYMLSKISIGLVYVLVCLKAWTGAFGIGYITQYVGAITALCSGVRGFFLVMTDICMNACYLDSIKKYLEIPEHMYQGSLTTEKRSDRNYEVEFKNVSFKYPGTEQWVLRNVSMKFRIGSRLAIVGENGSGKSTFIKLLCRLYDPQEGEILLNGIDIRKYKYEDYMELFSVVFQDFKLLAGALGSNVAGKKEYDPERAAKCLEDAGFAERLASMEKGLDTQLYREFDENGVEPSGGEAQKIAIARALYKDAPFLILDEPTAALDPIAEAEIYAQLNQIAGDKTSIYISHRLSSCRFCEEILVFDKGNIVEQGSHEKLLENIAGKYHALWNAQAQYYV